MYLVSLVTSLSAFPDREDEKAIQIAKHAQDTGVCKEKGLKGLFLSMVEDLP